MNASISLNYSRRKKGQSCLGWFLFTVCPHRYLSAHSEDQEFRSSVCEVSGKTLGSSSWGLSFANAESEPKQFVGSQKKKNVWRLSEIDVKLPVFKRLLLA